jgi:CubicO group peptidase (beta-lactamase class C family)
MRRPLTKILSTLAVSSALLFAGCADPPIQSTPSASAQAAPAPSLTGKAAQISALVSAYHKLGYLDGAVLVAEKGAVIYKEAFGLANREWNVPNTVDTRYRIASITKTFTATLVLQLVEEGKVKLDAKVTEYLPDYRKDSGDKVTIHHLLAHESGIPDYVNTSDFWLNEVGNRHERGHLVTKYMSGDLRFEPGSKAFYNNTGYFLLGMIIEKVTGKKFEEVLDEKILRPAGMTRSGYLTPGKLLDKMAYGYTKTITGIKTATHMEISNLFSGGGMYATVDDLYRWDQALYAANILSEESKQRAFKPYLQDPMEERAGYGWPSFGYAWYVGKRKYGHVGEVPIAEHGGNAFGFRSLLTRFPEDRHLIVLLMNEGSGSRVRKPYEITEQIVNVLYGKPVSMPKRSLSDAVIESVLAQGIDATMRQMDALRASSAPLVSDAQLNVLGCDYMYSGMLDEAIAILKLNVELYPKVGNCYDSLGEAYMLKGNTALAIENYTRALELDPSNANAVQKLKELRAKEQGDRPAPPRSP